MRLKIIQYSVILFFFPATLLGDIIFLRNQKYLKGSVIGQDAGNIIFRTSRGNKIIPKRKIKRVVYIAVDKQEKMDRIAKKRTALKEKRRREELQKREIERQRLEKIRLAALKRRRDEERRKREAARRAELNRRGKRKDAILRSAVAPGWGQIYQDRTIKGGILLLSHIGLGFFLFLEYRSFQSDSAEREDLKLPAALSLSSPGLAVPANLYTWASGRLIQSRMENRSQRVEQISILMLGLYVYNLFDIFRFEGYNRIPSLSFNHSEFQTAINATRHSRNFHFRWRWKF